MSLDVLIICPKYRPLNDGLSDYTFHFLNAYKKFYPEKNIGLITSSKNGTSAGPNSEIYPVMDDWKLNSLFKMAKIITEKRPKTVLIQYVPYMYGHAGINFQFCFFITYLKFIKGIKFQMMAHEINYPISFSPKTFIISVCHLLMFLILGNNCSHVFFSTEYLENFGKIFLFFRRNHSVLQVGSNIKEQEKSITRTFDVSSPKKIVLFGSIHPSKNYPIVLSALSNYFNEDSLSYRLLIIGVSKEDIVNLAKKENIQLTEKFYLMTDFLGNCSEEEVSSSFNKCHLAINYFVDGISSRRGSAIAALFHGVPLLTTITQRTDKFLLNQPFIYIVSTIPEIFEREFKEFLFRYKTIDELEFKKNSDLSKEFAVLNFSWERIIQKYISI